MSPTLRVFGDATALHGALADLLRAQLTFRRRSARALILPGGHTPEALYRQLANESLTPSPALHLLLSDERLVPPNSPQSNTRLVMDLVRSLRIDPGHFLAVRTSLPAADAARDYHADIARFVDGGGVMALALLGLGPDGHTAGLFDEEALATGRGRWAIAVRRPDGVEGVSLTPDALALADRVVFACSGESKRAIVDRCRVAPDSVLALRAVAGVPRVELWYAN